MNVANFLTGLNLLCGVAAIGAALSARFSLAGLIIIIGAIFDFLDGRVARWQGKSTRFGKEFDSLADLTTFGIAPAVTIMTFRPTLFVYGAAAVYALCAAIRLARFNIQKEHGFRGLPSPLAGLLSVAALLLAPPTWVLATVLVALAALMITPVRVPKI